MNAQRDTWIEAEKAAPEQIALFKYLFSLRHGRTPAWVEDRLEAASSKLLQRWMIRMVRCESLDQIFY